MIAVMVKEDSYDIYGVYNICGDINNGEFNIDNENTIEIDELIAPTIQVLNRKDYITYISCAGHPILNKFRESSDSNSDNSSASYIIFNPEIYLPEAPLPLGFYTYKKLLHWTNDERIHVRKDYKGDNVYEVMRDIVESMGQLYDWALDLPNFKSE